MKGFTLVEILVTLLIMGFIVGAIFAILNVANLSWNSNMGSLDLQQEVRQAMDYMIREIRQSKPMWVNNNYPSCARVDFTIPSISNPIAISYFLLNNVILREYPAGTFWTIANDISSLDFCCLGGASWTDCANSQVLQIRIRASKIVRSVPVSFPMEPSPAFFTEKVKFRNE